MAIQRLLGVMSVLGTGKTARGVKVGSWGLGFGHWGSHPCRVVHEVQVCIIAAQVPEQVPCSTNRRDRSLSIILVWK